MAGQRWQYRPEGSNWGDFGPDDEIGRLNLLTSKQVRAGIAEAQVGQTFCLSLPLDLPGSNLLNPRRYPPRLFASIRPQQDETSALPSYCYDLAREGEDWTDVNCDDLAIMWLQYSTQWDALAHMGQRFDADGDGEAEQVFYNGWRAGTDIHPPTSGQHNGLGFPDPHAGKLGIERIAETCVQGRGVMVDLRAHFGDDRQAIGYDDWMGVIEADRIEVETGDLVCLHTGFADHVRQMAGKPDRDRLHGLCTALDGRDDRLLRWITDSNMAALIADNYAVEIHPAKPATQAGQHAFLPLHEHCLFKLGLPLGELWYLTDLAAWLRNAGRYRFLLTAPPLRLPGAVGSPTTPVATV